jgi:hypothetical protein
MEKIEVKTGYVYHIKDSYFGLANDEKLMSNRESGMLRPTYLCLEDDKSGLLWTVPMSRRVEKYRCLFEQDIERYKRCLKIIIGEYAGSESVFLLQNMFPILPEYIDHVHKIRNNPVPVNTRLQRKISQNLREILRLHRKGITIAFTDILRLEKLMLNKKE